MLKKLFPILIVGTIFTSCADETLTQQTPEEIAFDQSQSNRASQDVIDGRLYFATKEEFQSLFDQLNDKSEEEVAGFIGRKGIISLRPIVTEENEQAIYDQTTDRIELLKRNNRFMSTKSAESIINDRELLADNIDNIESQIGDDTFAALLNSDGEVQIGSNIYKYTDTGLFVVEEKAYENLKKYLEKNNIADNFLYQTSSSVKTNFVEGRLAPSFGLQLIDPSDGIYFFPIEIYTPYNPPANQPNPQLSTNPTDAMYNYVNNLQSCSPTDGLFDNIFGDNEVCTDKYEKKRRVKTKAYNYNYLLVYNLGVKVKHQYRGWTGFWRKENVEDVRLGVTSASFVYDYSSYFISNPSQFRITSIYNNNSRLQFDATTNWAPGFYPNAYTMTGYSTQNYPKVFRDDYFIEDILNKYVNFSSNNYLIDKAIWSALDAGNKNLASSYLNKKFWDESYKFLGDTWQAIGKPRPDNNMTYSLNVVEKGVLLVHKSLYRNAPGGDKIEKSFDWGFQAGINIGSDGQISPNVSGSGLKKPAQFKVTMYGIAKRNGQWHGSKINTFQ